MKRSISLILIITFFAGCVGPSFAEEPVNGAQVEDEEEQPVETQVAPPAAPSAPQNPGTNLNQQGIPPYQRGFAGDLADDVNIATGSLTINQTDIYLPGRAGLDLVISRSYNSRAFSTPCNWLSAAQRNYMALFPISGKPSSLLGRERDNPKNNSFSGWMGQGWSFNFAAGMRVIYFSGDAGNKMSDQLMVQLNGDITRFIDRGNGVFLSSDPAVKDIVRDVGEKFVLINKSGAKYYFDQLCFERHYKVLITKKQHKFFQARELYLYLSRIEDVNGNIIKIDYERSGGSFSNEKEQEIDGRSIKINFDFSECETEQEKYSGDIFKAILKAIADLLEGQSSPERLQYQIVNYIASPLRPAAIADTFGRKVTLRYETNNPGYPDESDSRIIKIEYQGDNGQTLYCKYEYENGNLAKVIPPQGRGVVFGYNNKTMSLESGYDDKGYLLTAMTYPTGAKVDYVYDWFLYDPGIIPNDTAGYAKQDSKNFSAYVVKTRTIGGNSWHYEYSGGRIFSRYVTDSDSGRMLNIDQVKTTDPLGNVTENNFSYGLIAKTTDPLGRKSIYAWDVLRKNPKSIITRAGNYYTEAEYLDYDDYGNPKVVAERGDRALSSDDRLTHFEYAHESDQALKDENIVNRVKHTWVERDGNREGETYFDYDPKGRLIQKRDALNSGSAISEYSYDGYGNLIKAIDPNGNIIQSEYAGNSSGPTKGTSTKLNLVQTKEYYPYTGLLKSETDYNGGVTRYEYDKIGRLTKRTNPDVTMVQYSYDDQANEIEVRDERRETSVYKYDNLGRLAEVVSPDGLSTKYQYNALSKITSVADRAGRVSRYVYDQVQRLTEVIMPDGSSTKVEYEDEKNTIKVADADGNVTQFKNNGQNELAEVIEATGDKAEYKYSVSGKVKETVDPRGIVTRNRYDMQGRIAGTDHFDGTGYQFEYDPIGNLVKKTDGKGARMNYSYDALGRIVRSEYPDPTFDIVRTYDAAENGKGFLSNVKDPSGTTAFKYDKRGRIAEKSKTIGGNTFTIQLTYDETGNMLSIKDPVGNLKTHYKYDEMNKVVNVKRDTGSGMREAASYAYNPSNTIKEVAFQNGNKIKYAYDLRDRVNTLTILDKNGNEIVKYKYDYDAVGNLMRHEISPTESFAYGYDKVYWLTDVSFPSEGGSTYSYDRAGNRTGLKYAYGDVNYFYEPRANELDYYTVNLHGKVDLSYDPNGNLIKERKLEADKAVNEADYAYDPEDRLIEIKLSQPKIDGVDMQEVPPKIINMVYDANGMRAVKTANGETTLYHYDLANNVICETDENGKVKSTYIYANGMRVCRIDPQGKMFFFLNDPLGSPIMITDEDGNAVQRYIYDPFGTIILSKGTNDNRYTYTGKEYDAESGLMYYGARFYDPKVGRFTTRDIAGPDYNNTQSLNRYAYCLNNPLVYVDPDGEDAILYVDRWVNGVGHMGLYFQNAEGKWFRADLFTERRLWPFNAPGKLGIVPVDSQRIAEIIQNWQKDIIYFKTTGKQDQIISEYIASRRMHFNLGVENYDLLFNNCVLFSVDTLQFAKVINSPLIVSSKPGPAFDMIRDQIYFNRSWNNINDSGLWNFPANWGQLTWPSQSAGQY